MDGNLFNPVARRAEDTVLLTNLMQDGELPLFVANATVHHAIPLSLTEWFRKTIRSACLEARTYDMIGAKSARFRVSHRERLSMSWSMWKISGEPSIGRSAWFVLAARQSLRLIILYSFAYRYLRGRVWLAGRQTLPKKPEPMRRGLRSPDRSL